LQQVDDINKLPAVIKSKLPSTMLALPSPVPIQWAHMSADAQSSLWQAFNDSIMPAYVEHKLGKFFIHSFGGGGTNKEVQALYYFNFRRTLNLLPLRVSGSSIANVNYSLAPLWRLNLDVLSGWMTFTWKRR
jgi:hypothetical protein